MQEKPIPGLPRNVEATRRWLCQHVFESLAKATAKMDYQAVSTLGLALIDEIEHSVAIIERENRWKRLVELLSLNNPSSDEIEEMSGLLRRQGL